MVAELTRSRFAPDAALHPLAAGRLSPSPKWWPSGSWLPMLSTGTPT